MSKITTRVALLALTVLTLVLFLAGCSLAEKFGYDINFETRAAFNGEKINDLDSVEGAERIVSQSPGGDIKIYLGSDNNLFIKDKNVNKIIYRNYEKDRELFKQPYSLWSFDFFRIQWSEDGRYAYIIDSIYDVENDRLITLKDCLIFSWIGNTGVYLADGKLIEGKFWDHGFYGLYTSKKVNVFEGGSIRTAKQLQDERYFIVSEDSWNESEKTLFRCLGPCFEISTARLKYGEDQTYDRLIKAYQELREDEKAWELLESKYTGTEDMKKALEEFEELRLRYPVKLMEKGFFEGNINWDFDMGFYLTDIKAERIS